ncbi:hypothetical protein Pmani_031964 [Petrolisthes manimaculis]|uniref:Uncharacterized protein n=1 Tax=Petrolisthes manimaculis TaxID=1843537 RepID=A0AAE1TS39_9EUCA|nr:hypothetical protein Pmani_031964 [Petrolisthes manimaculis]
MINSPVLELTLNLTRTPSNPTPQQERPGGLKIYTGQSVSLAWTLYDDTHQASLTFPFYILDHHRHQHSIPVKMEGNHSYDPHVQRLYKCKTQRRKRHEAHKDGFGCDEHPETVVVSSGPQHHGTPRWLAGGLQVLGRALPYLPAPPSLPPPPLLPLLQSRPQTLQPHTLARDTGKEERNGQRNGAGDTKNGMGIGNEEWNGQRNEERDGQRNEERDGQRNGARETRKSM